MIHSISLSCYQKDGRIYTILIWVKNSYKRINSFLIVLTLYYLFKDETVCKTNSFIYASLFDDRTVLQSWLYHYTNISFLFSCLDLDQCQDDTKKIYLWKIWQINVLDIWMTRKSLEGEKQYSCSLKTMNEE